MIRVKFNPAELPAPLDGEFADWCKRADQALATTLANVAGGNDAAVESRAPVWRDHKTWLLCKVFHHKCAYCEGDLAAQTRGAAEHFRPKKGVSQVAADGTVIPETHPGYWWLAFSWENLVPACPDCNAEKGVKFPVRGTRVCSPEPARTIDELDAVERPLLLHPFRGPEPERLIGFLRDGSAYAKSRDDPEATATITVCALNRWGLKKARARRQEEAVGAFLKALLVQHAGGPAIDTAMANYEDTSEHYSRAVSDALAIYIETDLETAARPRAGGGRSAQD